MAAGVEKETAHVWSDGGLWIDSCDVPVVVSRWEQQQLVASPRNYEMFLFPVGATRGPEGLEGGQRWGGQVQAQTRGLGHAEANE